MQRPLGISWRGKTYQGTVLVASPLSYRIPSYVEVPYVFDTFWGHSTPLGGRVLCPLTVAQRLEV